MTTVIVPDAVPEAEAPVVQAAAVEAQAEAAVAIAEVQEEGATARAEIAAEAATEQTEALAEAAAAVSREEVEECRRNIGTLTETVTTLSSQVQSLLTALEAEVETEEPPNPNEPPASDAVDPPAQETSQAEVPPEPVKKKPAVRWT